MYALDKHFKMCYTYNGVLVKTRQKRRVFCYPYTYIWKVVRNGYGGVQMVKITDLLLKELIPYENNPRDNQEAVDLVINSIKAFGFNVPIIVDRNKVIVAGHTRYLACKALGIESIPCIFVDNLTEEQVTAYRLIDNKIGESSGWDFEKLKQELEEILEIDMEKFGFVNLEETEINPEDFVSDEPLPEKEPKWVICEHCGKEFPLE